MSDQDSVTVEMIEAGAAALWRVRGYSPDAIRGQLRSEAEAVLRAAALAGEGS